MLASYSEFRDTDFLISITFWHLVMQKLKFSYFIDMEKPMLEPRDSITLTKGEMLKLACSVQGNPTPVISWYKDSECHSHSLFEQPLAFSVASNVSV